MTTKFHIRFLRHFKKRIKTNPKLHSVYDDQVLRFEQDPTHPSLGVHKLKGKLKQYHAFWVTRDIRVVFLWESEDEVTFLDIGTHDQVYSL